MTTITQATSYDYPISGGYADTVGTLPDGRIVSINTQYECVQPHGEHAEDCDQLNIIGGRCTCGLLDGIDVAALVADARINGKRGYAPTPKAAPEPGPAATPTSHHPGWCDICRGYCYGDCQA